MPLKTLVVICLRLYAIYWLILSISQWVAVLPMILHFNAQLGADAHLLLVQYFLIPLSTLVMAILLWIFASKLATLTTKEYDAPLV